MRRQSVSLPTKNVARDPFEKPDRYGSPKIHGAVDGMKDVWTSQSHQRQRWIKGGAIAFVLLTLIYLFSPTGADLYHEVGSGKGGQVPADASYGTDMCKESYSKDKPIVQYVLMVDAGSTGSRIHVYKFNNCGPVPKLEGETFKMTEKPTGGLSAYKDDPKAAAATLDALLQVAMDTVPDKLKGCTPIAVKATAGLRMIGLEPAKAILAEVRRHLEQDYPFPVVSEDNEGVVIMDGSDEGVYAWITTNYLLGKIGGPDKGETAAVFDLGGGSTQIVFEPTFKGAADGGMPEKLAEGDHKYELNFGGQKFDLYQHSHLGYGLVAARKTMHETLVKELADSKESKDWMKGPIVHPCIVPNTWAEMEVKLGEESHKFNFTGPSQPAPAQCRNLAEKILEKDAACALSPCSFKGVYQPSLAKTFAREDVYIFSFFFDRTKPLGMPNSFTLREMHDLANTVCTGEEAWGVFSSVPGALKELKEKDEHEMMCLDLNFMMALLHTGYDMPIDREVKIAKKIDNNELGWCLGASLPLLAPNSGWQCKVKQIQ